VKPETFFNQKEVFMIVIPPRDPNQQYPTDPAAEALGKLYEQFTNVQNLGEFHAALRKRDTLYEMQHQEMADNPQDYENLHPRDFYRQFDRRADEDDKSVISEAPYRIRQQLTDALWAERDTAKNRALESYKKLFIDRQLAQLDEDRLHYFGKIADAANDVDRERYLTALIGRLKLSGDVGLLYKDDADRLIENIPSDLDIFTYNREYASDPARAQRLLLYGAYPNIRPELRDQLVKAAGRAAAPANEGAVEPAAGDLDPPTDNVDKDNSETNKEAVSPSNDQNTPEPEPQKEENPAGEDGESDVSNEQYAAAAGTRSSGKPRTGKQPQNPSSTAKQASSKPAIGEVRGYLEVGKTNWRAANDQIFIDAAKKYNEKYGLSPNDPGYITPEFLKSWAMIESGGEGDRKAFLTDPFQVNDPRNWVPEKAAIAGLKKGEAMTPQKSAAAALEWLRYKSFNTDQQGKKTFLGIEAGLKKYNTREDLHDEPSRMWQLDYHPGMLHKDWYAAAIMLRENDLLKRKQSTP
jgi:hypothetical protein